MPKKKYDPINIDMTKGGTLTADVIENAAAKASLRGGGLSSNYIITDEFDYFNANFKRCKEFNKLRFLNYCHKGTIITHATSKVQWEVQEVYEHHSPPEVQFEYKATFIKMKSRSGGSKTGKKYIKNVNLELFYMYDVTEVSDTVKVLWGDPKTNPPRKPEDFK